MNHLLDTDDEKEQATQLKFLETLIHKLIKRLEEDSYKPKVQDALKAIQLKQNMAKTSEVERSETHRAEKIFWQEIESIRKEVLPKLFPQTLNLKAQIQNTIIGLKHLVRNGILPVKTITDLKTQNSGTFNQGKSKESQLTYHRIGRLLSSMGFRKAKTQTGTYAILWDDELLSHHTFSNAKKNVKQTPVSPVSPAGRSGPRTLDTKISQENFSPRLVMPQADPAMSGSASATNYREMTFIPSFLNKATVTPSPSTNFPFLLICPHPHEGLLFFIQAIFILNFFAIFREANAPRRRKGVASSPFFEMTRLKPARTSFPPPSAISTPALGMESPPKTSGQMGIAFFVRTSFSTRLSLALFPSKRQGIPQRQAETRYWI